MLPALRLRRLPSGQDNEPATHLQLPTRRGTGAGVGVQALDAEGHEVRHEERRRLPGLELAVAFALLDLEQVDKFAPKVAFLHVEYTTSS